MSDESQPKKPVEGKTQAFCLKMDGWMSELMNGGFDLETSPPVEAPLDIEPAPPPVPADPPQGAPPKGR